MRLVYPLIKRQRWGFFRYKKAPLRAGPIYYLNDELKRYPDVKKDQEYATGKVVRKFLSGQMKVDKDTLDAIKKPVDNVTKVNIIESSELLLSDRDSDIRYSERYQSAEENSDILSMAAKVESGNFKANEKVYLGNVSENLAKQIQSLTGINTDGFAVPDTNKKRCS